MMTERSKQMCGHGVSVNQRSDVCLKFIVCEFLFYGYPCSKTETWRYSARKVMEFCLLIKNVLVYVLCKFEMCIFIIALVISENVRIAFLYVVYVDLCFNMMELFVFIKCDHDVG